MPLTRPLLPPRLLREPVFRVIEPHLLLRERPTARAPELVPSYFLEWHLLLPNLLIQVPYRPFLAIQDFWIRQLKAQKHTKKFPVCQDAIDL